MRILQRAIQNKLVKWMGILLAICTCLSAVIPVYAAGNGEINITQTDTTTKAAVAGIKLTLYQVAELTAESMTDFTLTEDFAALDIDTEALGETANMEAAVHKIEAWILEKNLSGMMTKVTDQNGSVPFTGLNDGIYLVKQTNTTDDFEKLGYTYTTSSYLVSLPRTGDDGVLTRQVVCQPKGSLLTEDPTQLTVYKVWKDNNDQYGKRPDEITIGLYAGDLLVEEVTLSAINNWCYEWTSLNAETVWTVKEISVPDGYTSTISQEGTSVTITNTYNIPTTPGTTTTTNTKLPQTGGSTTSKAGLPKTGDMTNLALWIALIAIGCTGLAFGFATKKRRNRE